MNRRTSHKDALVELMRDGRWYHMASLQRVGGWRYGARLWELKHHDGYDFEKRRIEEDVFEYRLILPVVQPVQLTLGVR